MFDYKPRLYLAGKVAKNGWRSSIVPEVGDTPLGQLIDAGDFWYCGPYVIACDHGCAHGAETHGLGEQSCMQIAPPHWLVPGLCFHWLQSADLVFAWIDDPTCFGTLVELGWAQALGKPSFIGFSDRRLQTEMWFAAGGRRTQSGVFASHHDALQRAVALAGWRLAA